MKLTTHLILFVSLFALGGGFAPSYASDNAPAVQTRTTIADGPLAPQPHFGDIATLVRDVIGRLHYAPPEFDADLSARALDRYVESLDRNRSYFLASDIAEFEQFRDVMVQPRRAGDLKPAYEIHNRYHQRVKERVAFLYTQLAQKPDFTVDEDYRHDRSEAEWAQDAEELDDITRRRFKNDALTLMLAGQDWDQVVETLERRYRGIERRADQAVADDVFQAFMNAVTTSIDPHTSYMTPAVQDNFRIDMSLSLEGIGAVLTAEDDYTRVVSVVPAGPADRSNALFPEDRIIGIAQGDAEFVDVVGWRIDDVVKLVRGPKGTEVRLLVLPAKAPPDAAPTIVALERQKIRLEEQAAKKSIIEVPADGGVQRIGVIDLPTFYADFSALQAGDPDAKSTTRDVRRLLGELKDQGVDGVIIDLRGNGGGSLSEATDLASLFVGAGPVVQIRTGDGATQVSRNQGEPAFYTGPLAVLTDRRSASGSEIFAGVIQDYGRGVVIGDRTFGKGTVQQLVPLDRFTRGGGPRLGELKLTVAKFYRVSGGSNQHRGIVPDIALPSPYDETGFGESARPTALPWDEIAPTGYPTLGEMSKLVDHLRARHEQRVDGDEAFGILLQEYDAFGAARNRHTVSLHREKRMQETEQLEGEQLARENARRALQGKEPLESMADVDPSSTEGDDVLLRESARIVADLADELARRAVVSAMPVEVSGS